MIYYGAIMKKSKEKDLIIFDEENEELKDEFILIEYNDINKYPPDSNPPITNFNNPYSFQKGLDKIINSVL
jgi:hypothetical protein